MLSIFVSRQLTLVVCAFTAASPRTSWCSPSFDEQQHYIRAPPHLAFFFVLRNGTSRNEPLVQGLTSFLRLFGADICRYVSSPIRLARLGSDCPLWTLAATLVRKEILVPGGPRLSRMSERAAHAGSDVADTYHDEVSTEVRANLDSTVHGQPHRELNGSKGAKSTRGVYRVNSPISRSLR